MAPTTTAKVKPRKGKYLHSLDRFKRFDEPMLRILDESQVASAAEFAAAVNDGASYELARISRLWLASAVQRKMVRRNAEGKLALTRAGASRLTARATT